MSIQITVLGAGSWGTALAEVQGRKGNPVRIWDRDRSALDSIRKTGMNEKYHPGHRLSENVGSEQDLEKAVRFGEIILYVLPSHAFSAVLNQMKKFMSPDTFIVSAAKGMDTERLETLSDSAKRILGEKETEKRFTVLSGPSFAKEVIEGIPTAVTIAGFNPKTTEIIQQACHTDTFHLYGSDDVLGVELAGSLKNVIAIAAGASDGFGFGHNGRSALITRGLAEISRIGKKLGAHPLTFAGLSGMGDLVLTCTGDLSRNRRVGLKLAQKKSLKQVMKELGQVAEGIRTAKAAYQLTKKLGIQAPILETVYRTLYEKIDPQEAIADLLAQPPMSERD